MSESLASCRAGGVWQPRRDLAEVSRRDCRGVHAAAATTVWLMMIMGFAITAGVAGKMLDPYTPARLVAVTATGCENFNTLQESLVWA